MSDPTEQFFTSLSERGMELPAALIGVVRCDIEDEGTTEHWFVRFTKSGLKVSREGTTADCVLRGNKATFDAVVTGHMNAMAALLRGLLEPEGRIILLTALQRLFPGPPDTGERPVAGYARRRS
jgi:hypothetical protein